MVRLGWLMWIAVFCGCGRAPQRMVDADLAQEIEGIRAIDHHAHPVRVTGSGEKPDREFDALPVDHLEASSDPEVFRPGAAAAAEARRALFGGETKEGAMRAKGAGYPGWVLDRVGVDIMIANRVEMGPSMTPPRFRWAAYADALLFPLDNSGLARKNSDRAAFFRLEDQLRGRYLRAAGFAQPPATLGEYLARVVTPTLERHKAGGAVAEKFEAAYLRTLEFERVEREEAERIYRQFVGRGAPADTSYQVLQDYLFRYAAKECGRLGMAVHLHTMAGAGSYFGVEGANPLRLESVLNDPELRQTKFVMVHGGWPFTREITALLVKPNAWLDFSAQDLVLTPATLAGILREWLEYVPEKVLFGTDAYPYSAELGWEESAWIAGRNGRKALAMALTAMMRDGEITRARAEELARLVLRENARALYGL